MPGGTPGSGDLGANRYEGLLDDGFAMHDEMSDALFEAAYVDGRPPFTAPTDPVREFEKLTTMKVTGDPAFWGNPAAQKRYAALEPRYGTPMLPTTAPAGGPIDAMPIGLLG